MANSTVLPPIRKDGTPKWLYETLRRINDRLGDSTQQLYAVSRGESTFGGGTPIAGVTDHGLLAGLSPDDDHDQYLLLRGRPDGQIAFGSIDTSQVNPWVDQGLFHLDKEKNSTATWVGQAITNGASVGQAIVLTLATHSDGAGLGGGATNYHTTITDSKGNTWTKHREWTVSHHAGVDEVTISIWTTIVTVALVASVDILTVNLVGGIATKALEARKFNIPSGSTISLVTSSVSGNTDTDPASMTISGLVPGAYLFVRGISFHQDITVTVPGMTPSGGFTPFADDHTNSSNTTSQASFRNVCARGEFEAIFGTSSTSDPTIETTPASFFPDDSSIFAAFAVGTADGLLHLQSVNAYNASYIRLEDSTIYSAFDFFYFRNKGTTTNLSHIRGSDGAFVGPVYPTILEVMDSVFRVTGSSDTTKKLAFEVDTNVTAGTTVTLTIPNISATILLTRGASSGQVIGTAGGSHGVQFDANDLAIHGQLLLDPNNTNFGANATSTLDIRPAMTAPGNTINVSIGMDSMITNGTLRGIDLVMTGAFAASGTSTIQGFRFITTGTISTAASVSMTGGLFQTSASTNSSGLINSAVGLDVISLGDSNPTTMSSGVTGLIVRANPRAATMTNCRFINLIVGSGTSSHLVTNLYGIDIFGTGLLDQPGTTNFTALNIPSAPSNPRGTVRGLAIGNWQNHFAGPSSFGMTTTPRAYLHLEGATSGTTVTTCSTISGSPNVFTTSSLSSVRVGMPVEGAGIANLLISNRQTSFTVASVTTTNGSPVVTTTGTFNHNATGVCIANQPVSGTGIPAGTVITSVDSATQLTLSNNATASGTVTLTFTAYVILSGNASGTTADLSCGTTNGSLALTSAALFGNIVAGMAISGTGIQAGTTVASVTDASNIILSTPATATGTATLTFTVTLTCGYYVPIKLTSAALLTAYAGNIEHYLDGLYFTPTTTVVRQQIATDLNVVCADGDVVTYDDNIVLV